MTDNLANDRIGLIRYADKNSPLNCKIRHQAFNIVSAICEAFSPKKDFVRFRFEIGLGYIIAGFSQGRKRTRITLSNPKIHETQVIYLIDQNGKTLPGDKMLPLKTVRIIAEDMEGGWLLQVLQILHKEIGRDAALMLDERLKTPYAKIIAASEENV